MTRLEAMRRWAVTRALRGALGRGLAGLAIVTGLLGTAGADEVLFTNGDRITGTITQGAGGQLTIKSDTVGEVKVDLSKVKTFSTAQPVRVQVGEKTILDTTVSPGADGTIVGNLPGAAGTQVIALKDVTRINPPPAVWTGSVTANGMLTRGNSETETVGIDARAVRRTDQDRITFGAGYQYGRQEDPDTGKKEKTADYLVVLGKYDYFFTQKFYVYAGAKVERDTIADLDLRFAPGVGVGYQWFEGPTFNLNTEAGVAWIYEDFRHDGTREEFAARLAYHVDWRPITPVLLFHNFEYLPTFHDPGGDYLLNVDAGARITLIGNFFTELKGELRHDETPAPGRKKDDWRLLFGLGWNF